MYGFIHCCLEDMVLQLFGEPAWREILNVAGIKLRGASFLMHQVYDDETTFKLVAAASQVSGLPMEVCLEEFGKHFLVYCQKNGYDQILRVLGSNLYDFLTNLDNLHDHLASIYPGMRAPSFRVTRNLESNGGTTATTTTTTEPGLETRTDNNNSRQLDGGHMSLAAGSMYLHYYSERKGLSPIVKGLVLAVAREFFSTDIVVTECKLLKPQLGHAHDHVVLKIDRRSQADIKLDEQTSQAVSQAAAEAAAQQVASPLPTQVISPEPTNGAVRNEQQAREHHHQQQLQHKTMLSSAYGDTMSKLASDSLINSEIMMRTFPFHVIFDRHFNLVQVGNALLRVTSLYWQRRQQQQLQQQQKHNSNRRRGESGGNDKQQSKSEDLIKFGDLFSIVRPKIEFTFDAIADHTNQVFVVKTRPNVLNADYLRSVAEESGCGGGVVSSRFKSSSGTSDAAQSRPSQSLCPMSRMAMKRRSCAPRLTSSVQSGQQPPDGDLASEEPKRPSASQQHGGENDSGNELSVFNLLSLRLKGQMIILSGPMGLGSGTTTGLEPINQDQFVGGEQDDGQQGPFCLYLCSPRVDHLDQLMECGVKMSDLALHDRARELMLMSHTHKEDREAVKKLDQATNDLKKMDTKLRQENKRTNEVLHNIFPAKIATLLSHGTKIESESFDLVTCLYSDIIGFTKMCGSENVRPIDIVRLLNTLYLQFDNLTNIHGVYKVETIGDAYVIVGGLPEPLEDHADRCVRMGLDMVKVIATVRSPADNQPIQMRIGIHSGPVMAGIVGIRVPRYSLFGNTTTLANQLETHGVGGKIHISSFTLKNLIERDRFVIEDNPNQISGFPFKTYFVTNYLGDQTELLKHEKILEEQLIKDFELMGNEVELVDDSSRGGAQSRHQPQFEPADTNKTATRGADLVATTRSTVANEQVVATSANLHQSSPQTGVSTRYKNNASSSTKESDSLVLMDVEDGASQPPWSKDEKPNESLPIRELVELSTKLSDEILNEALVHYSDLQTFERLLALLTNQYTRSRLAACFGLKQASVGRSMETATGNQMAVSNGCGHQCLSCPFCLGDGQLALTETERNWIKLMAIAANVALTLAGEHTNTTGRVSDASRPVPSLGEPTMPNSQTKHTGPITTNLDEQNNSIAGMETSAASAVAIVGDASETIIRQANTATDRQLSQNEREGGRTPLSSSLSPPAARQPQACDMSKTKSPGALSEVIKRETLPDRVDTCGRTGSITSLRTTSVTATAAGGGGETQTTTLLPAKSSQEQPTRPTDIISSLELTLEGLRLEREGLATQVRQLKLCLNKFGLADEHDQQDGIALGGGVLPSGEPPVGSRPSGGGSRGINRPLNLSSNIQRMKRMDTLKRRKINRDQELQQQQSRASSLLTSPLSSASVAIYENSDGSRSRHANSDLDACSTPLVNPALKQKTPLSGRQPQQSVLAYHQSPEVNNNLSRTQSGSSVGGGVGDGDAILESANEGVGIDDAETEFDQPAISKGERHLKQMNVNNNGSIENATSSSTRGAQPPVRPVLAPGGKKEPVGREASSNSSQQQRTPLKQQQSAAAATTYIFQSVRSSLASLMNETVSSQRTTMEQQSQQQNQQERRKRFSLNAFGMGISAAIGSPFSSPKKTAQGRQQSVGERIDSVTRKTSEPRSHSSSSGCGNAAVSYNQHNQKNQPTKGRWSSGGTPTSTKRQSSNSSGVGANTATNCSCLRSSGSDHSIESDDRMVK